MFEYQGTRQSWSNCHKQLSKSNKCMKEMFSFRTWCLLKFAQILLGRIIWGEIIWRVIIRGKIIQTQIFRIAILLEAIDGGEGEAIIWRAIILGDNCPRSNFPGGQLSGGTIVRVAIIRAIIIQEAIVRGVIIWGAIVLEPYLLFKRIV